MSKLGPWTFKELRRAPETGALVEKQEAPDEGGARRLGALRLSNRLKYLSLIIGGVPSCTATIAPITRIMGPTARAREIVGGSSSSLKVLLEELLEMFAVASACASPLLAAALQIFATASLFAAVAVAIAP